MMKKFICLLICFLLPTLSACDAKRMAEHSFFAMDTIVTLKCSKESAEKIEKLIREYESILSPTNMSSELYLLNNNLTKNVSQKFLSVFKAAYEISEKADGNYNFGVYPLILEWGFTTKNYNVPSPQRAKELLALTNFKDSKIENNTPYKKNEQMIDFGGIAKGFVCDEAVKILKDVNEKNALLSLGGNVYAHGKEWKVAIKSPFGDFYAGILKVQNCAVVTSGSYERYFEKDGKVYHHIIDPETGYPADNTLASVTIVSENASLADGYSTALFVMGFEKACEFYRNNRNFDAIFILKNGDIFVTEGIADNFSAEKFEIIR